MTATELFAENLKRLRKKHGLSQGDLAKKIGSNRSTIAQTETGLTLPRQYTISALARALGEPETEFFRLSPRDFVPDDIAQLLVRADEQQLFVVRSVLQGLFFPPPLPKKR